MKTKALPVLSEKDIARFWSKVKIISEGECWEWLGGKTPEGYGRFWLKGKLVGANRIAWFLKNGPIPDGMLVCHDCDNPPCCNAKHFFLGSHKKNTQDAVRKGRMASGNRNGSITCPENLIRGEALPQSKITNLGVLDIRKRYLEGETQKSIAERIGVSQQQVSNIINKNQWTHV